MRERERPFLLYAVLASVAVHVALLALSTKVVFYSASAGAQRAARLFKMDIPLAELIRPAEARLIPPSAPRPLRPTVAPETPAPWREAIVSPTSQDTTRVEELSAEAAADLAPLLAPEGMKGDVLRAVAVPEGISRESIEAARRMVIDLAGAVSEPPAKPFYIGIAGLPSASPPATPPMPGPGRAGLEAGEPSLAEEPDAVRRGMKAQELEAFLEIELFTYEPGGGEDGYFLARLTPRRSSPDLVLMPKDLVVVVDASKSVLQENLDAAKEGLARVIDALPDTDRFDLVVFRDMPRRLFGEVVPAVKENKAAAIKELRSLRSEGETDIYRAVYPLAGKAPDPARPYVILVASDGRPTVGETDSRGIIARVAAANEGVAGIYAFGSGGRVNRFLLSFLTYWNRGAAVVAASSREAPGQLDAFGRSLANPILTRVRTAYASVDPRSVYPQIVPDLFLDTALELYGRYRPGTAAFAMRIAGDVTGQYKELVFREEFAGAAPGGPDIALGWAYRKVFHLSGLLAEGASSPGMAAEIARLQSQYSLSIPPDWLEPIDNGGK